MRFSFAALFILLTSFLFAQETPSFPDTLHLREIIISANRWEQDLTEVPSKVATINQRTLQFQNPQTSADLLNFTGNVPPKILTLIKNIYSKYVI